MREHARVGAEGDLDARPERGPEGAAHVSSHLPSFGQVLRFDLERVARVEDRLHHVERGNVVGAVLLEHPGGLVVHVGGVLDRAHARLAGPDHALLAVGVGGHEPSQAPCLLDRGFHLLERVGGVLRVVAGREHASGGEDLDDVGALLDVEAHLLAHLVHAVGHAVLEVAAPVVVGCVLRITVAAGHGERPGRDLHARPRDLACGDRVAQSHVHQLAAAHVATRGEAGHDRVAAVHHARDRGARRRALEAVRARQSDTR